MKLENPSAQAATLEHFWMPFTANRQFKAAPRLLARRGHANDTDGREVLDGTAGSGTPAMRAGRLSRRCRSRPRRWTTRRRSAWYPWRSRRHCSGVGAGRHAAGFFTNWFRVGGYRDRWRSPTIARGEPSRRHHRRERGLRRQCRWHWPAGTATAGPAMMAGTITSVNARLAATLARAAGARKEFADESNASSPPTIRRTWPQ
jgi:hypothetical protein